jgi:hypothetical protein
MYIHKHSVTGFGYISERKFCSVEMGDSDILVIQNIVMT